MGGFFISMKHASKIAALALLATSCMNSFDYQGHRGARGLMPENTLPAFHKALDLDVTTLELDLCVSADSRLVVSHEPWFSHEISTHPDSIEITEENEKSFSLYHMSYDEIIRYDVGLKPHPRFPVQQKVPAVKPLFSEMIEEIESRISQEDRDPIWYNIETKSLPAGDGIFHPAPDVFASLVLKEVNALGIKDRVVVQSFDVRTLQEVRKRDASVKLALLVESSLTFELSLKELGFIPEIFSPNYEDLTQEIVDAAKKKGMKVIPWTVNEVADMQRLVKMGVDGLISDYPDRFSALQDE